VFAAGIPVLGELGSFDAQSFYSGDFNTGSYVILSGTQAVVVKLRDYVIEHSMPGREGGVMERIGSASDQIDIHGIFYEGQADYNLNQLQSLTRYTIGIQIPSFTNGAGLINSGSTVQFEDIGAVYVPGHGYPYYQWRWTGVISGALVTTFESGHAFDMIAFDNQPLYAFDTNNS
jgi:hypothetical protein